MQDRPLRNRLIPGMIALSILLICAFAAHWLYNQWNTVHAEVRKSAAQDLRRTGEQLADSLVSRFISNSFGNVFEKDDSLLSRQFPFPPDTLSGQGIPQVRIIHSETSVSSGSTIPGEIERIHIPHGGDLRQTIVVSTENRAPETEEANEQIKRGLNVIIRQMSTPEMKGRVMTLINGDPDTALTASLLKGNWQQKGLDYAIVMLSPENRKKKKDLIVATGMNFGDKLALRLTNENRFIFSRLWPQFLAALFLIVITSGAFLFAWRSFKKQWMLNRLRTDFINNISHELKTPVSTVRVALEALQHYNRISDPEVTKEYLTLMRAEVDRLDGLVQQVLTNGMLESGADFLQKEIIDFGQLIREVAQDFSLRAGESGGHIFINVPESPVKLSGDPAHLRGVIANLIDNSLKYAGKGVIITLHLSADDSLATLTVSDNGPGIDPSYHTQLFNRFFRVPDDNRHNVKGYGLGLSYSKDITERHGGRISLENLPEGGCRFTLQFPIV